MKLGVSLHLLAVVANDGVALAGESFQLRAIGDFHRAAAVFDQSRPFAAIPAARVTLGRSVPSMVAKKS